MSSRSKTRPAGGIRGREGAEHYRMANWLLQQTTTDPQQH